MSLYDIMDKKPAEDGLKAWEIPVDPAPTIRTVPVRVEPQAVQKEPETAQKFPYTWWWQTPEYLSAVESSEKVAAKQYEQDKKRLRRERNVAILGDLAKLAAQTGAVAGGAWKVDAFAPETQKVNDKFAALRERRAADVAAFAKQRAAAKQALIADNNARMKLEISLAEADIDRKIKAATEKTNQEFRERTLENEEKRLEIAKQNADTAAENAAGKKKSDATYEEYYKWLEIYPEIKVKKPVAKKNAYGGYVKNDDGTQAYEYVDNENPSLREVENAIAKAKDLERRGVKGGNTQGWDDSGINEELIDEDFK